MPQSPVKERSMKPTAVAKENVKGNSKETRLTHEKKLGTTR